MQQLLRQGQGNDQKSQELRRSAERVRGTRAAFDRPLGESTIIVREHRDNRFAARAAPCFSKDGHDVTWSDEGEDNIDGIALCRELHFDVEAGRHVSDNHPERVLTLANNACP